MDIFISWSKEISKEIALKLNELLPLIIQSINPFMSEKDISKGVVGIEEIGKKLSETNFGIVCVTKENMNEPWLNFESGALSKNVGKSNVCTLLFDLKPTEIKGPLKHFQATIFTKEDFFSLIKTINSAETNEIKIPEKNLEKIFETNWKDLEKSYNKILREYKKKEEKQNTIEVESTSTSPESNITKENIEEILLIVRDIQSRINISKNRPSNSDTDIRSARIMGELFSSVLKSPEAFKNLMDYSEKKKKED